MLDLLLTFPQPYAIHETYAIQRYSKYVLLGVFGGVCTLRTFILTTMRQGPPWIQRYRNDNSGKMCKHGRLPCGESSKPVLHLPNFVSVFFSETYVTSATSTLLEGAFDPGRSCPGSAAQAVKICSSAYCAHS